MNNDSDYRNSYMSHYENEWLDRAVAFIVVVVFLVALYYALRVITLFWSFFRVFFAGVVVAFSLWLLAMLWQVIYRYKAKTEIIEKTLPMSDRDYRFMSLPSKPKINWNPPPQYQEEQENDYKDEYDD
jgi:hypothetical protein